MKIAMYILIKNQTIGFIEANVGLWKSASVIILLVHNKLFRTR